MILDHIEQNILNILCQTKLAKQLISLPMHWYNNLKHFETLKRRLISIFWKDFTK